jgi:hypothetical protein
MPGLRVAVANGNWSNSATWNDGFLPGPEDIVCANGFTVTIDQDINVGRITNTAQSAVTLTATMTSNTTPSGIVDASSFALGRTPYFAFDGNTTGTWWTSATGAVLPQWISYEFQSPKVISRYKLFGHTNLIKDFTFEGWNGSNWVVLDTVVNNAIFTYTSVELANTTAYIKYRINVTALVSGSVVNLYEIYLFERGYTNDAIAGGGFTLSGSYILDLTFSNSIQAGSTTCLTFSGVSPVSATINAVDIRGANTAGINSVNITGTGTLNINATISGPSTNVTSRAINIAANGIINIVGSISGGPSTSAIVINIGSVCRVNITGNITHGSSSGLSMLTVTAAATIYITGNIICGSTQTTTNIINISNTAAIFYITGNMSVTSTQNAVYCISSNSNSYINHIGTITAGIASPAISATSTSAINLFSGPFICGTYGFFPFLVTRVHLIPTLNNYLEFRDDTTNGAIQPGAIASASRLVSPDTIIDAPTANNVRLGVSYGNGAYTGTCAIPSASNVALNVPFDTGSVGTAYISTDDITNQVWGSLTSNLSGSNTIGERLKNAATVSTTGAQIASL